MALDFLTCIALIGGTSGALDSIDGDSLNDGDGAWVLTSDGAYRYRLNATSGAVESSPDVISPDSNAGDKRWELQEILVADATGDMSAVNRQTGDARYALATDPLITFDESPASDDTYKGITIQGVAGEALAQWDLLYSKNAAGVLKWYKYDANGADKNLLPRAMAVAAIGAGSTGTLLKSGIVRNDGWAHTSNQDEGAAVYGSATPGAITLTAPSTSGDIVVCVGHLLEENVLDFQPSLVAAEVA
jgi:hypothetical protein